MQSDFSRCEAQASDLALIANSGLFELAFYQVAAASAFASPEQAIKHYIERGADDGLDPGPYFATQWYVANNTDVAQSRINPLLHFINHGQAEGRSSRPEYTDSTLQQADELAAKGRLDEACSVLDTLQLGSVLQQDAVELRRLRFAYYRADVAQGAALMQALQRRWRPISHPAECQQLLKIHVYWLAEQGQLQQAREILQAELAKQAGWTVYLEWYKDFIENEPQLAEYAALLKPFVQQGNYPAAQALLLYAMAAKRLSLYAQACDALQQRWLTLQKLFYRNTLPMAPAPLNWSERAADALLSLKHVFAAQQQVFFLISGTLLGCVRDNRILAHDKDIDVGVFADTDLVALAPALRQSGCFLIKHQRHARVLQLQHINGVIIDIFVHWQEDGKMLHAGQKTRWFNSVFSLEQATFLGEQFWVPSPPEQYLAENYGDWQQPKVDYDTFADTPNMQVTDSNELQFHYLKVLPEHLIKGHLTSFKRIWQLYRSAFNASFKLSKAYYTVLLRQYMAGRDGPKR